MLGESAPSYPSIHPISLFDATLFPSAISGTDHSRVTWRKLYAGRMAYLPLDVNHVTTIVSRGGSIMVQWCPHHQRENFIYEHFEEICEIARAYNVSFSPSDSMTYAIQA